jgi:protein O-mannosyl-transferase
MAAKSKSTTKSTAKAPSETKAAAKAAAAPTQTFTASFWTENWMPAAVLMVLAFALYAIGINYGYVLDDEMVFWKNEYVQKGFGGLREIFTTDSFMGFFKEQKFLLEGGRYRPLSLATFAMEVGMFGPGNTTISHGINILLYGLTAVLLYRILLGLFPVKEGGVWYFSLPFIAAAVFTLHPLHVECVANIKGRDEILALLGGLGALWATLKYFDTQKIWWLLLSAVALFLGMMAKENALTFVAVIPLTVALFTPVSVGRSLKAAFPLLLAAVAFVLVRYEALGYILSHSKTTVSDLMNDPFLGMNSSDRLATIFLTLGWYIKLLFVPHPLTIDYYPYHVPRVSWTDWKAMLSLVAYAAMGIWALMNLRKNKIPAYAILFYLLTLSIVSNLFVSVGTFMNERFLYMPSVAFCLVVGWFFARKLPEWLKEQPDTAYPLGMLVFAAIAALFAFVIVKRIPDWQDGLTINASAVKVSPGSARSHCFYVTGLYDNKFKGLKNKEEKKPLVDEMEYHINESLRINPQYGAALIMKGAVAAARFEQDKQLDKLFHVFEDIIEKIPYNSNFRNFLDQYMVYLNGSNSDKYVSFCHRVGYEFFFQKRKDYKTALHFLQYGLDRQTEDLRILRAMEEAYTAIGYKDSAAGMRKRIEAQQ